MRRTCIYILILTVMVALLGSLSIACTCSKGQPTSTNKTVQSGASPTQTTGGGSPTPTGTSAAATSTSVPKPGGMPDIADMKSLSSYRLSVMTKMAEGTGAGSVTYMKYEYVKDQKAEHAWMEDASSKVTEVYIKIGDQYWIYLPGLGWVEQPPQATTDPSLPSDLASQLRQAQQDVENSKARFDKKGTETVNNVKCIRYEFEYSMTAEMPNLGTGGTNKIDMHSTGEMWIADQSGLPAVVIKSKGTAEMTMAGEKTLMDMEQNLTDIGAAITINPPEGATKPPTGPTGLPTSTPTATPTPTVTTTAPPPTGGTPTFNENFQGAWNDDWNWIDPNNDATYSFTAHAGFLRLTVPEDNDLAGSTNYDAPRLLVLQNGDFTIETLVEFDPQETYQGAGLLVWQDEDTFLRVEFGYGGMGGGAKNAVFVRQEYGALGLVHGIGLQDSTTRVELRLQRDGDQFTAWYRLAGGTWQEVGSTELPLAATVDVGIVQVTQFTSFEISADFDYFKVFAP